MDTSEPHQHGEVSYVSPCFHDEYVGNRPGGVPQGRLIQVLESLLHLCNWEEPGRIPYCGDYVTRYETLKQFQNTLSTCGRISSEEEFTEHVQNTTLKTYCRGNLSIASHPSRGRGKSQAGKGTLLWTGNELPLPLGRQNDLSHEENFSLKDRVEWIIKDTLCVGRVISGAFNYSCFIVLRLWVSKLPPLQLGGFCSMFLAQSIFW